MRTTPPCALNDRRSSRPARIATPSSSCERSSPNASDPVLLFSGGKDSAVLLHLAAKAFAPQQLPFPVMHIDTGQNFPEVLAYRDRYVERPRRAPDRRQGPGLDRPGKVADPGPLGCAIDSRP